MIWLKIEIRMLKIQEKILQEKENYPFKIPLIRLLLMMLAALAGA